MWTLCSFFPFWGQKQKKKEGERQKQSIRVGHPKLNVPPFWDQTTFLSKKTLLLLFFILHFSLWLFFSSLPAHITSKDRAVSDTTSLESAPVLESQTWEYLLAFFNVELRRNVVSVREYILNVFFILRFPEYLYFFSFDYLREKHDGARAQ